MSKWELGCIVFNSLVYKIFTGYPEVYSRYGGSAAWIVAFVSGCVFIIALAVILKFYTPYADDGLIYSLKKRGHNNIANTIAVLLGIYFLFGVLYALYQCSLALKSIAYVNSPLWFIIFFFVLCAVIGCFFGKKAIRRLHSLNVLGIGVSLVAIAILSFRYADGFNLTPVLGKGAVSVFGKGLLTLFMYSDFMVIFLLPKGNRDYSFGKTVIKAAGLAVIVNIAVVLALSLNSPFELAERLHIPLYPLTKTANLGKFPARLDVIYQIALISSAMMYISIALNLLLESFSSLVCKLKKAGIVSVCLLLCFMLCGCYDSKEVEEKAYIIALGIDEGADEKYKFTFQISNPLESGANIGAKENKEEEPNKNENKTVDNIVIEASDYFSAIGNLKSHLSKVPDISHIKLIVYSFEVAEKDAISHSEILIREREVRPGTNLCITESAEKFLLNVKPTLEESTVRYYELFMDNKNIPHAPVTELRDFVGKSLDEGDDAVVPVVSDNGLSGMGIFSDGQLKKIMDKNDVIVYKLLKGEKIRTTVYDGMEIIESDGKPKINVEFNNDGVRVEIELYIKARQNANQDISKMIEKDCESFLYHTAFENCDIIGVGRYLKKDCLTQKEWEELNSTNYLKKINYSVNVFLKNVKNRQIFQIS